MSKLSEFRHPDMAGLNLDVDPVGLHATIAENVDLHLTGEVDKRPGLRRLNHHRYSGPVVCIPDVQRICDYNKMLVISSGGGGDDPEVYEHPEPGDPTIDPFFDQNWAPIAVASAAPTGGVIPLTVHFSSAGSFDPDGGPLTYYWDFGDGSHSHQANPVHAYGVAGSYTATLTVTDEDGATDSMALAVSPAPLPTLFVYAGDTNAYWTEDSGATWTPAVGVGGWSPYGAVVAKGLHVYVMREQAGPVRYTVYHSSDGGKNFASMGDYLPPAGYGLFGFSLLPNGNLLVTRNNGGSPGLFDVGISSDHGATWNWTNIPIINDGVHKGEAVYTSSFYSATGKIYARIGVREQGPPWQWYIWVYRSDDGGATFAKISSVGPIGVGGISNAQYVGAPSSSDGKVIMGVRPLAGGNGIYYSADNGVNWASVIADNWASVSPEATAINGSECVLVVFSDPNFRKVYSSVNGGAAWAMRQVMANIVNYPRAEYRPSSGYAICCAFGARDISVAPTHAGPYAQLLAVPVGYVQVEMFHFAEA